MPSTQSSREAERWVRLGRFDLRLVLERDPPTFGVMLYGLSSRTPQVWLYLSGGPK